MKPITRKLLEAKQAVEEAITLAEGGGLPLPLITIMGSHLDDLLILVEHVRNKEEEDLSDHCERCGQVAHLFYNQKGWKEKPGQRYGPLYFQICGRCRDSLVLANGQF